MIKTCKNCKWYELPSLDYPCRECTIAFEDGVKNHWEGEREREGED